MTTVRVRRLQGYPGPDLVIEQAEKLARTFFQEDISGGFGLSIPDHDRVTVQDIRAVNTYMRARSSYDVWSDLTGAGSLSWLQAINPAWDLIELEDRVWQGQAREAANMALHQAIQRGRGRAVATKVLHMKRPRLFPILDSLVIQQVGAPTEGGPRPIMLMDHLRVEGQGNLDGLREVQAFLNQEFGLRSLIRILDALLWSAHPAASIAPKLTSWVRSLRIS